MYQKLIYLCLFCVVFSLNAFGAGKYPSPLPLPDSSVLNVEIEKCNSKCMQKLLDDGLVFSFVANFTKDNQNKELGESLNSLLATLEISEIPYFLGSQKPFFNLALLFPRKAIGRYSTSTTNTILSYLLYQNARFNFEIFDSKSESIEDIQNTLLDIQKKGYREVIAVVTQTGAKAINSLNSDMQIYIPSVHKRQLGDEVISKNIIFGAISYDEQIKALSQMPESNTAKVASFYDGGSVGLLLQQYTQAHNENLIFSKVFDLKESADFPKEMKSLRGTLNNSSIFLNTPVTNSSMILSQITYHEIRPKVVYSTQINYNPMLLSITQPNDRKNMFIANSIMPLNDLFTENSELLNVDLHYDWINYATAFGVEHFYKKSVMGVKKMFKESIKDSQVQYQIQIISPKTNRFMPL